MHCTALTQALGGMLPRMIAAILSATLASPVPAGDAQRGEQLYLARCGACHSLDSNGAGPRHRGVVGRRVASVPGFSYSTALQLATDPLDRADIIAFLQSAR